MRYLKIPILVAATILLVCCCASSVLAQSITQASKVSQSAAALKGLDSYVHKVMKQWQVPGLAIAVVKDGKVVLAKGYGVRELGKPGRVDADTLFTIASNTKAFTAAALGTLISSGKLTWDAPVTQYVKNFKLSSPYVTENITLRDLLTHRSGYCDPGIAEVTTDASTIIQRLRYQKPDYGFRAHFCYNNVMFLTAARFIPAITGETWNRYVEQRLFQPLQMTRTVTTAKALAAASDVALPHGMMDGKAAVIRLEWAHNRDVYAPIGSINSSVNDMSHWLLMLLANGRYAGKPVLKPAIVKAMETPQIPIQPDARIGHEIRAAVPGGRFYSYGLGLVVQEFHGHVLVWHAGDVPGMASVVAMVPDSHLGIVVLSNMNGNDARFGILNHVLQSYLGLPQHDVSQSLYEVTQKMKKGQAMMEKKLADTRTPGTKAPLPLKDYAGTYRDDFYGTARIGMENGHLVLHLGNPNFVADLEHWHNNTFRVKFRYGFLQSLGSDYLTFQLDAFGNPVKITSFPAPFHYERSEQPMH
ncbi:MAG: serine hydrolase [Gammaproteobacteria bacterium]